MPASFLYNQVRQVLPDVVKTEYPERVMVNGGVVNIDRSLQLGAKSYEYYIFTALGTAAIYAGRANDIPSIASSMESRTGYIRYITNKVPYSLPEQHTDQAFSLNYVRDMLMAANEGIKQTLDEIGFLGDKSHNLLGLLNNDNVPLYSLPADGAGGLTTFASKAPWQIYRDLNGIASSMRITTNMVRYPDVFAIPLTQYEQILSTTYVTQSGDAPGGSILKNFLENQAQSPVGIRRVVPLPYLAGKGLGGTDIAVAMQNRPTNFKFHVPVEFAVEQPRRVALGQEIDCYAVTGGMEHRHFDALLYVNGI